MTEWREVNTADLISEGVLEIGDGYRAKNSEFVDEGGLPFVRVGNIGTSIRLDGLDELPIAATPKYGPKVSQPLDSLITMKGTVGRVAYVNPTMRSFVYSPQISYWRSYDHERVHPRWLRYWLESPEFSRQASATKGSTDMADYINLTDQRRMRITLPPAEEQAHIADVLGSIDDLIENNRRRVEVLEEMARAIYREWFVHFRYPGHEHDSLVDSPVGPIPEGWEAVPLVEAARITMGQSPKSEFYNTDGLGKPFHQGVTDFGSHFPTHRKYCTVDGRLASDGDVLVSVRAPVGRLNLADTTLVIGRGLAAVRSRLGHQSLLFATLKEVFAVEDSMGGGTIFKAIGKKELEQITVLRVPDALATCADRDLASKSEMIRALTFASRRLADVRDHLLPKLVTGQIDVSSLDLDALVEGAGA